MPVTESVPELSVRLNRLVARSPMGVNAIPPVPLEDVPAFGAHARPVERETSLATSARIGLGHYCHVCLTNVVWVCQMLVSYTTNSFAALLHAPARPNCPEWPVGGQLLPTGLLCSLFVAAQPKDWFQRHNQAQSPLGGERQFITTGDIARGQVSECCGRRFADSLRRPLLATHVV